MNFLSQKSIDIFKKCISKKQYDEKIDELTKKASKAQESLAKAISLKYTDLIEACETLKQLKKPISELININTNASIYFQEILAKIVNQKSERDKYESVIDKLNMCLSLVNKIKTFYRALEGIDTDDLYDKMCNLKIMESHLCYFKNFLFYYTLKNIYEVQHAKFQNRLHDETGMWIDDAQKCFEYVGRQDNYVKTLLFDQRYDFMDAYDIEKFRILHFISEKMNLKEEFEEIINKKRYAFVDKIASNNLTHLLNIFRGFYILDFYLSKISNGFVLKHHVLAKKIIKEEKKQRENLDIMEVKCFYASLINFQRTYGYETMHFENEIKDACFDYFMKNKLDVRQFSENIHGFIAKGQQIIKEIEYLDVGDMMYKTIDDMVCEFLEHNGSAGLTEVDFIVDLNKNFYWRFLAIKNDILESIRRDKFIPKEKEIIGLIEKYPENNEFGRCIEEKLNFINDEYLKNKYVKQIVADILMKIKSKFQYQQNIAGASAKLTRQVEGNYVIFESMLKKTYPELFSIYCELKDGSNN